MKYLKVENNTNLVWEISGSSFGTGSDFYEITSSQFYSNFTPIGQLCISASVIISTTGSPDISSVNDMEFVDKIYRGGIIDFKKYRDRLKVYAAVNNFDSLSLDEQTLCVESFAVEKSDRDTLLSEREQVSLGREFHYNSVQARTDRIDAAVALIYNNLSLMDGKQIIKDVIHGISGSDDNLIMEYKDFGIEGTLEGDTDGLFDYILSRTGSCFSASGLLSKNYTPISSISLSDLCDEIMAILQNGHYLLNNS